MSLWWAVVVDGSIWMYMVVSRSRFGTESSRKIGVPLERYGTFSRGSSLNEGLPRQGCFIGRVGAKVFLSFQEVEKTNSLKCVYFNTSIIDLVQNPDFKAF